MKKLLLLLFTAGWLLTGTLNARTNEVQQNFRSSSKAVLLENASRQSSAVGESGNINPFGRPAKVVVMPQRNASKAVLLEEGFESEGFNFPPEGWTLVDADGDGKQWTMSMNAHSGTLAAQSESSIPGPSGGELDPDNWLISPKISIPSDGVYRLTYYVGYENLQFPSDKYGVYVSTTDTQTTSFEEIHSEVLSTGGGLNYHEVMLSLADYAGEDVYIAFRHYESAGGIGRAVLLDDVVVEEMPMAPMFSGELKVSLGSVLDINPVKEALYVVKNSGTQDLTVSYASASPELTLAGLPMTVAPQALDTITVILNTTTTGDYAGNFQLTTNDPELPTVKVEVIASVQEATVNDFHFENFESGMPEGWMYWGFSVSGGSGIHGSSSAQSYAEGINMNSLISSYIKTGSDPVFEFSYRVTDGDGIPTPSNQVYYGIFASLDYGATSIPLYVVEPGSANEHVSSADFRRISIPLEEAYKDTTCIFLIQTAAVNGGNCVYNFDNLSMGTRPEKDLAIDPLMGPDMPTAKADSMIYSVAVANVGVNTQTSYTVRLLQGENTLLGTVAGPSIASGEVKIVEFKWLPLTAGPTQLSAEIVLEGDENSANNRTRNLTVNVQEEGVFAITVGTGNTRSYDPINMWNSESASQTIYYVSELGANTGTIHSIMYKTSFEVPTLDNAPRVRLYIGETDKTDFMDKIWIDVSELTPIYDGRLQLPKGESEWRIPFDEPYTYHGGNLVIYTVMTDLPATVMGNFFYVSNYEASPRTITFAAAYAPLITPENPDPIGKSAPGYMVPNVSFFMEFENTGSISGVVSDTDGVALAGAKVEITGTSLYTQTNASGRYEFPHLKAGDYTLKAGMFGYADTTTAKVTVNADAVSTCPIVLTPQPRVALTGTVTRADNGNPIEGARVTLAGIDNYQAVTDATGAYSIQGIFMDNRYALTVTCPGFVGFDTAFDIAKTDLSLNIVLDESPYPVQLLHADLIENDTKVQVTWTNSIPAQTFRYDSDIRMSELGLTGSMPNAMMGSVYRTPAELYEMSWFSSIGSNAPNTKADLYILDLDTAGMPTSTILYSAKGVANIDGVWNTHTLTTPVSAPNGFMLAIGNAYGFAGLGIAAGTEEYPFRPKSNFYTQDYSTELFIALEDARYELNFMIRATGIEIETGERKDFREAAKPEVAAAQGVSYSLYRFAEGQPESAWVELGKGLTDTMYVDSQWSSLPFGVYHYAVKAHYTNLVSVASISNPIAKDMQKKLTVNLTTTTGESPEGAVVTLTHQDGNPAHVYTMTARAATVEFPEVWRGIYDIAVSLTGYAAYEATGIGIESDTTISITLKEVFPEPYRLRIETTEDPSKMLFTWNNEQEVAFWDDMESYEDFIIENIGSYILRDVDGIPTWVIAYSASGAYEYPNNGYTGSYQVMNPSATVPVMTTMLTPHSGDKILACVAANNSYGPGHNDDWLILPRVKITKGMVFKFWAKSVGDPYQFGLERIKVGVSTTREAEDFTFISTGDYIEVSASWKEYTFELGDYVDQEIYLAINCVSDNAFMLAIDDVFVGTEAKKQAKAPAFTNYEVYLDDEKVATTQDTRYEFTGLAKGTYTAGVKSVYETGESEIVYKEFMVGGVDNEEEALISDLKISPNPFNDQIKFSSMADVERVRIITLTGTVVKEVAPNSDVIRTDNLPSGFYFIHVEGKDGKSLVYKMVKR